MELAVNAVVHDVLEDLLLQEIVAVLVELIGCSNQRRQPVLRVLHPSALTAFKRRIALLGERILDTEPIEGADEPLAPVDLGHAGRGAELLGYLCEHGVALADEQV